MHKFCDMSKINRAVFTALNTVNTSLINFFLFWIARIGFFNVNPNYVQHTFWSSSLLICGCWANFNGLFLVEAQHRFLKRLLICNVLLKGMPLGSVIIYVTRGWLNFPQTQKSYMTPPLCQNKVTWPPPWTAGKKLLTPPFTRKCHTFCHAGSMCIAILYKTSYLP